MNRPRVFGGNPGAMCRTMLKDLHDPALLGQPLVIVSHRGVTTLDFAATNGLTHKITRFIHPHGPYRRNRNARDNASVQS
jgi:hypothetical protein